MLERLENETDFEYKLRLCLSKLRKEIDLDWQEIADKLGLDVSADHLRKTAYGFLEYDEYKSNQISKDDYLTEFTNKKQELQKERQKLADERTALNKILREDARSEENWNKLETLIKKSGKENFLSSIAKSTNNLSANKDLIVCLSDLHLGLDVTNNFGVYNLNIAKDRLNQYLNNIINIGTLHNVSNVHVMLLGDIVNGSIHVTTRLENRENAIEQTQKAAEIICGFIYELSTKFNNVTVSSIAGNHSRIGLKDEVLRDERLDNIIPWYAKAKLSHIDNIVFNNDNYDTTLGKINIYGNEYWLVHGDYDAFNEAGISKLVMMIGKIPTAIFMGHMHHCSYDDINNIKIVRSGCLNGTVDDYSISKRLKGKPSQMVCVCSSNGIEAYYPIELN